MSIVQDLAKLSDVLSSFEYPWVQDVKIVLTKDAVERIYDETKALYTTEQHPEVYDPKFFGQLFNIKLYQP